MTLQDHMADAIYRAILECQDNFPPELVRAAISYEDYAEYWERDDNIGRRSVSSLTWRVFKDELAKYADELPELLK